MNKSSQAKADILESLRKGRKGAHIPYSSVDSNKDYFVQPTGDLAVFFKKTLENIAGNCEVFPNENEAFAAIESLVKDNSVYCISQRITRLLSQTTIKINNSDEFSKTAAFSITSCKALSARTGSVVVTSRTVHGRKPIAAPENHIVIAYTSQLFADLPEALNDIHVVNPPSQITVITGPSRTADIEKTLVLGAHGPKNLYVFLIDNTSK